ncbi:FIMAH domain-containing protein [Scopulibacillus darangshiensis]|uniref:FIMAH domain-containing protein n=1 Tax=Scopulibacillus darangshiensis TaxID=442528 RepID=UPI00140522CA|nr:metallophosphoesterase [Scopulibacillus darangshiensis]
MTDDCDVVRIIQEVMVKRILKVIRSLLLLACIAIGYIVPQGAVALANSDNMPPLLITELVPDATDINGVDGYEFIEVYNNTDKGINLKDYKILYRYPTGPDDDLIWAPVPDNVVIQPGQTMVFWIMTGSNEDKTVADFNANYGTDLVENQDIVRMDGGMHNDRKRTMILATNTGHEIVAATYNESVDNTEPDKGIMFKYPEDGSNNMVMISNRTKKGTPGTIEDGQVPDQPVHVENDTIPPTISNLTKAENTPPTKDVDIVAEPKDDVLVRTFTLYYKTNKQTDYKEVNLRINRDDSLYHYKIGFLEFISADTLDYYFVASDGTNRTTSSTYKINIDRDRTSPRLNVRTGDILTGKAVIKGSANGVDPGNLKLLIDGSEVKESYRALEQPAYFAFEADGMNTAAQDAVTMGKDVLQLVDGGVADYDTVAVPVDPEKLTRGENTINLRAGSIARPYYEDDPESGLDDFLIRNARLILADGTVLRDPEHSDPTERLDMGDNGRFLPVVNFHFNIPSESLTSKAYKWETASTSDGKHRVTVEAPHQGDISADVFVDNNGPLIKTTLINRNEYKGKFVIDVTATDNVAGVQSTNAKLDDEPIDVPYNTSSAELAPGEHTLHVKSVDKAGNQSNKTVEFSVVDETPDKPSVISPKNGAAGVSTNPNLSVKVADPTNDNLDVSFYKAYKYNAASQNMAIYRNATGLEPPHVLKPDGEKKLTEDEVKKLQSPDGQYMTTDSTTQFPYLRFNVKVDGQLDENDTVRIHWEGKSLKNRKVTMYAWNHSEGKWMAIDSFVTDSEENFNLDGEVGVQDFVRDNVVNVLIQDQIPPPQDYDYTFVWMSDTQIYSELYPDIYESEVNWIKNNKDAMNIKYVFHTGDIVNQTYQENQWDRADRFMKVLGDANIPYGVLAGNHDVGASADSGVDVDYSIFYKYFSADRFRDKPYYGESFKNNRGHYDLISANGNDYIMVYLGWGVGDEGLDWVNKVLADHPDRKAILSFHSYLLPSGERSTLGEEIYQKVVVPNKNVHVVLGGHYHNVASLTSEIDDNGDGKPDRNVYQMLADYNGLAGNGSGYMRLLHFDSETNKIYINTYSPYLDDYNYYDPAEFPGKDEFTISMDLKPEVKRVATDYFDVSVYSDEKIGTAKNIASGKAAKATWHDLNENQTYYWYARAEDRYGGKAVSDIWRFTTKNIVPAPSKLRVDGKSDTTVKLAWEPVKDEGSERITYELYEDDKKIAETTDTAYMVKGLDPDTAYHFTVIAKNEKGEQSEPSDKLTVKTLINASVIHQLIKKYGDSGDLRPPLLKQLSQKLTQAEHFYNDGSIEKAIKHLDDFLKLLNKQQSGEYVSPEAKERLNEKARELLTVWRNEIKNKE